jgi:hypothetical protein
MKKLITILTLAVITACPLAGRAENSIESDPAYLPIDKVLDLKANPPQVNVNLPRFLLKDAISGLTNVPNKGLPGGIDLADLVKDVKLIRVVVLDVAKTNRPAVEKSVAALRKELDSKWTSVVSVPDKKNSVGVYAMGDPAGESMAGVAVLVADGNNVVIVNIVGRVSIGKLIALAAQSHKLPPELLMQLQGVTGQPMPAPSAKKADSDSTTNQPVEAPDSKVKQTDTVK